jgi:hypothetical protein
MGMLDFWREPKAFGVLLPEGRLVVEEPLVAPEDFAEFARISLRNCSLSMVDGRQQVAAFLARGSRY